MPSCLRHECLLLRLSAVLLLLGALNGHAGAGEVFDRVRQNKLVRVCIWPDYYGITYLNTRTGRLGGLDIDMAEQLAQDLGVALGYVDSSFPRLVADLRDNVCDIAMYAVARTPQRMEQLQFSDPYLQSGVYAITRRDSVVRTWQDIDKPGVRVGVPAGTFIESAVADSLKQAQVVVVAAPTTRERELRAGRLDVFMADFPFSRRLLDREEWPVLLSPPAPFHVLPYAYAMKKGDDGWRDRINVFVAAVKRDGRLLKAARQQGLDSILVP
jgi:cyclohexadienyl dehydratase